MMKYALVVTDRAAAFGVDSPGDWIGKERGAVFTHPTLTRGQIIIKEKEIMNLFILES